jgi:protein transport protein SEC61 subunit gamma-like protein
VIQVEIEPRKWKNDAKAKFNEYKRVLQISTKTDREEFEMAAKVTGAGMIIIGILGFIMYMISNLLPQYI